MGMFSAIILSPSLGGGGPVPHASEALVRSLSSLVRAAVVGVLRDVTIVGVAADDLAHIADHAGCAFVETADAQAGLAKALASTRLPLVFTLEGGYAPLPGFAEEAGDLAPFIADKGATAMRINPETLLMRLFPDQAPAAGVLASRAALLAAGGRNLPEITRRIHARSTMRIRAQRII